MEIYGTFIGSFLGAKNIGKKIKWAVRNVLSDSDYFDSYCKESRMTQTNAIFTKANIQSLVQRLFKKGDEKGRKNLQSAGLCGQEEHDYSEPWWCVTMVLFLNPSTFGTLPQSNLEPWGVTAEDSFWYNKIQFGCKKSSTRLWLRHLSAARILLNCWGKIFDFLVNTLLIC